ncbi:hypothetical protein D920_01196 [Enterococcus faecalis 13-SD-W-01]|nr:hypothetical protein D920_01196 [Enterococcus faecalis 13-SD-W-01]
MFFLVEFNSVSLLQNSSVGKRYSPKQTEKTAIIFFILSNWCYN